MNDYGYEKAAQKGRDAQKVFQERLRNEGRSDALVDVMVELRVANMLEAVALIVKLRAEGKL